MYKELKSVVLSSGEHVECGIIVGPDIEWANRLEALLFHKGEPWNRQNSIVLRNDVGIGNRFYVLHRGGNPFANSMISEFAGVGILAHVWTNPEDRGKGACSKLMGIQIEEFRSRQGKALFLFTEFDSTAYRLYQKLGFSSVETGSGFMEWYASSKDEFYSAYFKKAKTEVQPLKWKHWPSSLALFMGNFPGVIRSAPLKLIGRQSTQTPLLPFLLDSETPQTCGENPQIVVLQNTETSAVAGLAVWDWDPLWEDTCVVDVFCHPDYQDKALQLFSSLILPKANRYVAYCETNFEQKIQVLSKMGFTQTAILKNRVPINCMNTLFRDAAVFEK